MLGPGEAGGCNHVRIPRGTPPGRYRFLKSVGVQVTPRVGRSFELAAPFTVLPVRR
jgi:hypothetical protein